MLASSPAVSARTHIIGASGPGGIEPAGRIAVHPPWSAGGQTAEFGLMLQNLAAVTANFRRTGIVCFGRWMCRIWVAV
jgi:hypothetical protein